MVAKNVAFKQEIFTEQSNQSKRSASIGSKREARLAGYKPAPSPTTMQTTTASSIHSHGATNPAPRATPTKLPMIKPSRIPPAPPIWQITTASIKN